MNTFHDVRWSSDAARSRPVQNQSTGLSPPISPPRIPGLLSGGSSAVVVAPGAAASGSGSPAASMGGDAAASAIARRCCLPGPSTLSN